METPDFMPVLSGGGHASPKQGACFMEMESYLAGEKWGADLQCAHPSLRAMAIATNDRCDDKTRQELVHLLGRTINTRLESDEENYRVAMELVYWTFERFFEMTDKIEPGPELNDTAIKVIDQMKKVYYRIKELPQEAAPADRRDLGNTFNVQINGCLDNLFQAKFESDSDLHTRTECAASAGCMLVEFLAMRLRPTFLADFFDEYDEMVGRNQPKPVNEESLKQIAELLKAG